MGATKKRIVMVKSGNVLGNLASTVPGRPLGGMASRILGPRGGEREQNRMILGDMAGESV